MLLTRLLHERQVMEISKSRCQEPANIFWKARLRAEMSRLDAAIDLNTTTQTIYRTENGRRIPTPEEVCRMAEVYDQEGLEEAYCREMCPIGKRKAAKKAALKKSQKHCITTG